jgi:hypothetical protein
MEQERIVREELWRSIAWACLGIVGWTTLVREVAWVEQNLFTVFGGAVITWAVLTAGMIGIRTVTGSELQVQTLAGLSIFLLGGFILGGVGVAYLVLAEGYSPLLVSTGYIVAGAATIVWYWYAGVFDSVTETTN